jgi:hypothetical protein
MSTRKPRRTAARSKPNVTAHRRAVSNPGTQKLIKALQQQWKCLDQVERGNRLRVLLGLGCSKRGLADDLRVAEVTVRRHVEIASLPEVDRKAVIAGASAKKILHRKAMVQRAERTAARLKNECETGKYSDEVAEAEVPNLSAWRRSTVGDLTSALNFKKVDTSSPNLPLPSPQFSRSFKNVSPISPAQRHIQCPRPKPCPPENPAHPHAPAELAEVQV